MTNRFFITVLVIIALIGGAFALTKHKSHTNGSNGTSSSVQPTNHQEGGGKSGVVLIEYGDYQCPACGSYYPVVKQVVETHKDQITFQFRNFPLVQIHQNAFAGARAAEAADKQGKFWEMHDILYETQQTWGAASNPSTYFEQYAQQLGLDVTKFKADEVSQTVNDLINADIQEGQKLGANATPTFELDGKKMDQNPRSLDEFNKVIDDAIKAKTSNS
ncbi:MAG TPA: thioredoxin domain-containing protein [Patescibacteria group bacterium]|nr:thioredoxin domain-containing protein [Patescibacteria group bacterium]